MSKLEENDPLCQWCDVPIPLGRGSLCLACQKAEDDAQDDYLDDCMSDDEIEAAECAYENSRARAEWDHYHPGEPCPAIELPHPPKDAASDPAAERTKSDSQALNSIEQPHQSKIPTQPQGEGS